MKDFNCLERLVCEQILVFGTVHNTISMSFCGTIHGDIFTILSTFLGAPELSNQSKSIGIWCPTELTDFCTSINCCYPIRAVNKLTKQAVDIGTFGMIQQALHALHRVKNTKEIQIRGNFNISTILDVVTSCSFPVHLDPISATVTDNASNLRLDQIYMAHVSTTADTEIEITTNIGIHEANWVDIKLFNPRTNKFITLPDAFECGTLRIEKSNSKHNGSYSLSLVIESFDQKELLFHLIGLETSKDANAWNGNICNELSQGLIEVGIDVYTEVRNMNTLLRMAKLVQMHCNVKKRQQFRSGSP